MSLRSVDNQNAVPVPEVYVSKTHDGEVFIYMELIQGAATLRIAGLI
jgi:hypothetical protein